MKKSLLGLGAVILLFLSLALYVSIEGFCSECMWFGYHNHRWGERSAATNLMTLSLAQADFRANDRDGDNIHQFWRGDVAGLYALVPKGGTPIKLIELSVAAADDLPVTDLSSFAPRSPKSGYWFRAIRHVDEDPKAPALNRFAFCAFPDTPKAGKYIFIVDEDNTIYRAETKGRRGVDLFPSEEELRTQWSKIDG